MLIRFYHQEIRQSAKFTQYGLAAATEALQDAGFEGGEGLNREMTVGGPGNEFAALDISI